MEIQHHHNGQRGVFYVETDGRRTAEMTYVITGPEAIIIDHTEVSSVLKGQGVGKLLVRAGVDYARENGIKVMPLCPFAKAEFDKTPDYQNVLLKV